ncbi:hypothetical protein DM02DRAFT_35104 [Periconia macrospinosa]|uniref:Rhodopsin domain-containing protein n=1 Tax=Periconia macrospinosa TaxID=97972 RepID=A0A2V1E7K3_9PLEO|nr:hypothetical protein DM02DRAFT_35104 [Periconia macrospinosa]
MQTVYHGMLAVRTSFALTTLSTIVVGLRFYSRAYLVRKLGSSDWMMLGGLLTAWSCAVVTYYNNLYVDYSKVHDRESYARVVHRSLLVLWAFRFVYMLDHLFIKLSILLFYKYIASSHRSFHRAVYALIALVATSSIIMICISVFICRPVSDAWSAHVFIQQFSGVKTTQCLDPTGLWFFNAAFNVATDAIIWILPFPFFLHLQSMPVRRRLELTAIFSIGILAITASAVRLYFVSRWLSSFVESGKQFANLLIWSQVELHAGIIAASIPFLRPLAAQVLRKAGAARGRDHQNSPGPARNLMLPETTEDNVIMPRTPIIPSPVPTLGSDRGFRAVPSTLSPIVPVKPGLAIHTV